MRLAISFVILLFFISGCNQEKVVDDRPKAPELPEQQKYKEGEIIVRYEDNFSKQQIHQMLKTHGASIIKKLPGKQQFLIKLPFGHTVRSAVPLYDGLIGVKWAEPNYLYRALGPSKLTPPKDPGTVKVKPIKIRKVK